MMDGAGIEPTSSAAAAAPAPAPAPAPASPHTPEAPELVAVERLRVEFGAVAAVDDVTFSLRGGNLLGLIGPNGAGKTTLLRAVAGIHAPTRGRVRILGEPLEPGGGGELLRHVGFTPDTPAVYEELTVRQFLRFIAKGYALVGREVDERIDFWLERVWLAEKADQRIKELSRGMRQRVGLARTLLPNPSVILLDEPAAGLDPAGRVQFRQLLSTLRDQGKALVVSSHILADMSEYCTHIGIMAKGRLLRFGTVAEVAGNAANSSTDAGRCRYTAVLARAVPRLSEVLQAIPGASAIDADGDRLTLEYAMGRDASAELLAALMARGLPVASFTAHSPGLEEAYLRAGIGQVD